MKDDFLLEELWLDILIGRKARLHRLVRLATLEERARRRMVEAPISPRRIYDVRAGRWAKLMTSRMDLVLQLVGDMA